MIPFPAESKMSLKTVDICNGMESPGRYTWVERANGTGAMTPIPEVPKEVVEKSNRIAEFGAPARQFEFGGRANQGERRREQGTFSD
jgi:hypothetical protein